MSSVSFDNIEIVKFDSSKPKSAVPLEYVDGLFDSRNMYFQQGKLGLGITNPSESLDVSGNIQAKFVKTNGMTIWNPLNTSAQDAFLNIRVEGQNAGNPYISLNVENELNAQWSFGIDNSDNKFRWKNTQNFSGSTRMILDQQGFLGLGGIENPNAEITLPNINKNKKIVLYDINNNGGNNHQFSGFGTNANELRYQVPNSGVDHIFYSGINTTSSNELFRIKGNGRIGVGVSNPSAKMTIGVNSSELSSVYGLQIQSENNNSKGAGVLLTNNGVGGANFGIVSEMSKLNFVDQVSTPTNILSLDRQAGLELKNSSRTHLLVNGVSGNIGIGTTEPQSQLHIFNNRNSSLTLESSSIVNGEDAKINISQMGGTSGTGMNAGNNRSRINFITGSTGDQEISLSLNKGGDFSVSQIKVNNQTIQDSSQNKLSINRDGNVEIAQNLNVRGRVQENGSDLLPTGTILPFAGPIESIPSGFVLCDGASYPSNDVRFNRLSRVIGTIYGGSGGNPPAIPPTFRVPDLRCRFPLGAGSTNGRGLLDNNGIEITSVKNLASTGGTETHKLSPDEMPSHNHTGTISEGGEHSHTWKFGGGGNNNSGNYLSDGWRKNDASFQINIDSGGKHSHTISISNNGGNFAHQNMPPFLVINYIIKL